MTAGSLSYPVISVIFTGTSIASILHFPVYHLSTKGGCVQTTRTGSWYESSCTLKANELITSQPIKRRIPRYNPYPVIEIDRPGQSNNGNIEIIPSENAVPIQQGNRIAADEVLINGRRYRVPERTIVLDFWSKLSKRSASPHQ